MWSQISFLPRNLKKKKNHSNELGHLSVIGDTGEKYFHRTEVFKQTWTANMVSTPSEPLKLGQKRGKRGGKREWVGKLRSRWRGFKKHEDVVSLPQDSWVLKTHTILLISSLNCRLTIEGLAELVTCLEERTTWDRKHPVSPLQGSGGLRIARVHELDCLAP